MGNSDVLKLRIVDDKIELLKNYQEIGDILFDINVDDIGDVWVANDKESKQSIIKIE